MSQQRKSSSSSEEESNPGQRSVAISVLNDTGTQPSTPSKLFSNGRFSKFELTSHSMSFVLEVQTQRKKKRGNQNRNELFVCDVQEFPTQINPDSAKFEVLEPASGECFILLSFSKVSDLSVNWKEFLCSHGTIDAKKI